MKKGVVILPVVLMIAAVLILSNSCSKLRPSNLRANEHFQRGNHYYAQEKYKRAVDEYEEAIKLNPSLTRAYAYLGTGYVNLFRPGDESDLNKEIADKADLYLNKALELDPENKGLILSLAEFNDRRRNFELAEKEYLKVMKMDRNDPQIYILMANFYNSYDNKEKALEMYEKRIALDPKDVDAYLFPADYYFNRKMWDDAMKYHKIRLQKIEEADFLDEEEKNKKLADAYYRIGHLDWAHSYQTPQDEEIMSVEERKQLIDEGLEALQKATELDKTYPEPWVYMGLLWLEKDKIDFSKHDQHQAERDKFVKRFQELIKTRKAAEALIQDLTRE